MLTKEILAKMIDHSLLNPSISDKDLEEGCKKAVEYDIFSVCVKPYHIKKAVSLLTGSGISVITVIGFPHGSNLTSVKVYETELALKDGAVEFDMVINIGALKSGGKEFVLEDIKSVVKSAEGRIVKVILENCYLTDEEKILGCKIVMDSGAQFVKTSTGYGSGGAILEDVILMKKVVGDNVKIKAAGGIRSFELAKKFIYAGASRLGTTRTDVILKEFQE